MTAFLDTVAAVCRRLKVQPYLVGGTVRDRLAGRASHDWDVVCVHARRAAAAAAGRLSAKLITLDEQHRIYRVILPEKATLDFAELQGKTIEQDLARRDFTINAMAMPLTSTPSPRGEGRVRGIIDPFDGQKDLNKRVLRAMSRKAFQEDPLRLLRAYRMAAQFELSIEPRTARWIASEAHRLGDTGTRGHGETSPRPAVARERVREEFLRLLNQPKAAPALEAMDRCGLLTLIFPELEAGRRVGRRYYGTGGVVRHHLQSVANLEWLLERIESANRRKGESAQRHRRVAGAPVLRFISGEGIMNKVQEYIHQPMGGSTRAAFLKLGALLHDIGKPATAQVIKGRLRFFGHEDVGAGMVGRLLGGLRFSRQETNLVRGWVRNHMRPGNLASVPRITPKAEARFFRDMGEEGVGMLLVSLGDHYTYLTRGKWGKATDPVEKTARRLLDAYYLQRETVLPARVIDGHRLMKQLRLKPGPLIGKLLEAVRDAQAEGKVKTAEEAVAYARKSMLLKKG